MCYEIRPFRSWAKRNEHKSTGVKSEAEHAREKTVPLYPPVGSESARRKERRRATEEVL